MLVIRSTLIFIISLLSSVLPSDQQPEKQSYAVENKNVTLNCTSPTNTSVLWMREPDVEIFVDNTILKRFEKRFKLLQNFDLFIGNLSMDLAGKYVCRENNGMGAVIEKYDLVIISSDVSCSHYQRTSTVVGLNSCNISQSWVNFSCFVNYNGIAKPNITWIDQQTGIKVHGMETEIIHDNYKKLSSSLLSKAMLELPIYKCTIQDLVSCNTSSISVHYALSTNIKLSGISNITQKLSCRANSSTQCTYKWFLENRTVTYGPEPEVESFITLMGSKEVENFTCIADCMLDGEICSINVMAVELFNAKIPNPSPIPIWVFIVITSLVVALLLVVAFKGRPIKLMISKKLKSSRDKTVLLPENIPLNAICYQAAGYNIESLENISLPCYMFKCIEEYGSRLAFIDPIKTKTIAYNELKDLIENVAAGLVYDHGVTVGMRVGLIAPNCIQYPVVYYAILHIGAICVPIGYWATRDELKNLIVDSDVDVVITVPDMKEKLCSVKKDSGIFKIIFIEKDVDSTSHSLDHHFNSTTPNGFAPRDRIVQELKNPLDKIATISYSSGTTGLPKGCVHTHRSYLSNLKQMLHEDMDMYTKGQDVTVAIATMSHMYGQDVYFLAGMAAGCTMVVKGSFYPEDYLSLVEKHKATCAHLVPTFLLQLLQHPTLLEFDLSSLKKIETKAAHLNQNIPKLLEERLPNCRLLKGYGMTEAMCLTKERLKDDLSQSSVGRLIPGVSAMVVDTQTNQCLGRRQIGELRFYSPSLLQKYWGRPNMTIKTEDGFFSSGDVGYFDDSERLYIVDRKNDMIKCREELVSPVELENIILQNSKVKDVAVIGVQTDDAGESPMAFVVKKDESLTEEEVICHVTQFVAPHKRLNGGVQFVENIPKLLNGKIKREELRQQITSNLRV